MRDCMSCMTQGCMHGLGLLLTTHCEALRQLIECHQFWCCSIATNTDYSTAATELRLTLELFSFTFAYMLPG